MTAAAAVVAAGRDVAPDEIILQQIFPDQQLEDITIILQMWDKCVFKARAKSDSEDSGSPYIVRLEAGDTEPGDFNWIAIIQQVAATVLPELVPRTVQVGRVEDGTGRNFCFSVVEYVDGDLLEDVWEQLGDEERVLIVSQIVDALSKIHTVRPGDDVVMEVLDKMNRENKSALQPSSLSGVFGGPHGGFLDNGPALLWSVLERRKLQKPFCIVETHTDTGDIEVISNYDELGSVLVRHSDMLKWPGEAVLCHNDLNPRNLIVRRDESADRPTAYRLVGIIDWELAGFFPASYELSSQDTYLGGANRHVSFYLLLKEHLEKIVPRSLSQAILLQAMELIYESRQRFLVNGYNVSARIRQRFLEELGMVRDSDPYVGWVRGSLNAVRLDYSRAEFAKLENEVIDECC